MKRVRFLLALLAGIPSMGWADTAPAPQNAAAAATIMPPKAIFDIGADGTALHQQSQLQCPATLDGYARSSLHVFDKAGFDVACNYALPKSDITIYLTRQDPAKLAEIFEGERQAILKRFPNAAPRDPVAPPPGLDWKSASFSSGAQLDDLLLANVSDWEFQVRATYAADTADATHKLTADLSALMLKTAGAHLAACAAAAPPARTGQPVGDVAYAGGLALTGLTMARLGKQPDTAPVWCVEGAFSVLAGEVNPVFWRNIAFDGKSGEADRVTASDANILEVRLDPGGGEVAAKAGATMSVYDAILGDVNHGDLVGIFNGRPSATDLAKLLYRGPMHVYARFDRANKQIQLFTPKPAAPPAAGVAAPAAPAPTAADPGTASCPAMNMPATPSPMSGTVIGVVDHNQSLQIFANTGRANGGKVNPAFLDDQRVMIRPDPGTNGGARNPVVPANLHVAIGDHVTYQTAYRDPSAPCQFIPSQVVADQGPAPPAQASSGGQ